MTQILTLEIPYPDKSGNRHVRHGGGRHYLSQDAQDYVLAVRRAAEAARLADRRVGGPLEARWVLAPPDKRARDQTNVLKVCEDALVKAGVLLDDSNLVIKRTIVEWVDQVPGGAVLFEARLWTRNMEQK